MVPMPTWWDVAKPGTSMPYYTNIGPAQGHYLGRDAEMTSRAMRFFVMAPHEPI